MIVGDLFNNYLFIIHCSLFIVCRLLGRVEVLLKAPKKYAAAPLCAFLRRGRDRMVFDFSNPKPSAAPLGGAA